MSHQYRIGRLLLLAAVFTCAQPVFADDEQLSKELTTLFRSGRKVISDNQAMINDASKGDKGLSSTNVLNTTKSNFKAATGSELTMGGDGAKAKEAMLKAIREVMDDAQTLINEQGKGFKGFLPAVFARRVAEKFSTTMAGQMKIKLTAPKELLRNRANRADEWENNIIESKFKIASYEKGKAFAENGTVDGKPAYRYILPEYYGESCLSCHGEPKGETDITGGKKEGYKLGDLGGAVSFVLFK